MELLAEEVRVVHRGENGVDLLGSIGRNGLEQPWGCGHVEPLGRGEDLVVVDEREGAVLALDAGHAGSSVGLVAHDQVEAEAGRCLHVGDDLDRLIGGEHHRHGV